MSSTTPLAPSATPLLNTLAALTAATLLSATSQVRAQAVVPDPETVTDLPSAIDPVIGEFTHLHNEYIDVSVKRGVLGLLSLLLLYLVPLRMFMRMLGEGQIRRQPYAAAGAVLCVSYMDFGLSQAFLSHNSGVMVLFFMMVIIWSLIRAAEREPALTV